MGDETCNNAASFMAYKSYKLVFRQYACWSQYRAYYNTMPNVYPIPLGYGKGMLEGKSALDVSRRIEQDLALSKRHWEWSFIGNMKKDREDMVDAFQHIQPNFQANDRSKKEMRDIYSNSYFVLSGAGASIDCFRHYEASIMGAIPILLGTQEEIEDAFGHFDKTAGIHIPPWIISRSWDDAAVTAKKLLANRTELLERQYSVVRWWQDQMYRIYRAIEEAELTHYRKVE